MQRTKRTFQIQHIKEFKKQLLYWSNNFEVALWLDSNDYEQNYSSFDAVLAADEFTSIQNRLRERF